MRAILLAEPITAEDALQFGLVSELADEDVLQAALRIAAIFTNTNKEAIRTAKQAICRGMRES